MLLIHGAASNHTRWSEFVRRSTLCDRFDLVRPDMRGNARSMWRGKLDLDVWCRDLVTLLDTEGYERAIVIGHSLGAQIALQLAATHPQRVRALALIDPIARQALLGKRKWTLRLEPFIRLAISVLRGVNRLGLRRRRFPLMDLEALDAETRAAMQGDHPQRELVRRYSALGRILAYMPTANYLQQLVATAAPLPGLEAVTAPTLVLESAGVDFMDRSRFRAALARLPELELIGIEATHWPLTERPDEVRRAIESWIERL
ncbi:MAG: alpha/beta hydrolase [Xanthomonadales bacterium]|nr:alpha/beta hydrolase [Xanthomonadales bacterium]